MIVIIDNYDSFTYNLYQYVGEIEPDVAVIRNDQTTVAALEAMPYSHLIISPGPGYPQQAGVCVEAVRRLAAKAPILGVCLGHQAIGHAYGASIVRAPRLVHGKATRVHTDGTGLFKGLPTAFGAGRYHSLIVDRSSLPGVLKITAQAETGEIMGLQHRELPVFGVQFHPESILTPDGKAILRNFLSM